MAVVASVSTPSLVVRQTYLFWFLILAILHRKIDVTDNDSERIGRREVKRQERYKRVVLDLRAVNIPREWEEDLVPAGRSPCLVHETGCFLFPILYRVHRVHSRARVDRDRDTVQCLDVSVRRSAVE